MVVQDYRGSTIWCSSIKADVSFLPASRIPSGIRHKGNSILMGMSILPPKDATALRSGSIAYMKCNVEAADASNYPEVCLTGAKFEVCIDCLYFVSCSLSIPLMLLV